MEQLPTDIAKKLENLPIVSFNNANELQNVIMSQDFIDILAYYEEHYMPDEFKKQQEIQKRIALYLTLTNQDSDLTEQLDNLLYRRPVPTIEEFLDGNRYMGLQNASMYPYWREKLCEIFADNSTINRVLWSGATGTGKSLSNDTLIPTPNGKKYVKDIKLGDYLWGKNGKPVKIIGVYPQGKLDTYEIIFDDKTSVICSADHIWHIEKNRRFGIKEQDITTIELINSGLTKQIPSEKIARFKYKISKSQAVEYTTKNLPIHPYVLGLLIGDGCFNDTCILTSVESNFIEETVNKFLYPDFKLKKYDDKHYSILKLNSIESFSKISKKLNLYKVHSENKFIPEIYKEGDIEQRYMLLRGLLDSDGTIQLQKNRKIPSIIFSTISKRLALDVCELVRSLGGRANISQTDRLNKYKKTKYIQYSVIISIENNPFLLPRKANKFVSGKIRSKIIVDIKPTKRKEECTCFEVDSKDHLFLCNDYIVTHNTVTARKAIIYSLYKFLCLRYPRAVLNVEQGSTLACFILSVTQKTAYQTNFEPFIRIISNMPCFQRVRNMTAFDNFDLENPLIPFPFFVDKSNLTIVFKDNFILTLGSQISNTVGYDIIISGADEVNELGVEDGMELLNSIDGRVQGRFANSPFIMQHVMSSARSTDSVTREYVKKWQTDPNFLYLHPMRFEVKSTADFTSETNFNVLIGNGIIPSTVINDNLTIKQIENNSYVLPVGCELVQVPEMYRQQFEADIDQSIQDILGIDTKETKNVFRDISALENKELLSEIQLEVNIKDNINILDYLSEYNIFEQLIDGKYILKRAPHALRYIHVDLGGSGNEGQCDASLCMLHKEWKYNEKTNQKDVIYVVDLELFINAKNKVDIHAIQQFLIDLVIERNLPIHTVTADQWQSLMFLQSLEKSGCFENVKQSSVDIKLEPYTNAATLIELGQVKVGICPKLKKELEALIISKNKVTRTTELKDGCDALVGAIQNAQLNYSDFPQYEYISSNQIKEKINDYSNFIDQSSEELQDLI